MHIMQGENKQNLYARLYQISAYLRVKEITKDFLHTSLKLKKKLIIYLQIFCYEIYKIQIELAR